MDSGARAFEKENPEAEELAGRLESSLKGRENNSLFKQVWHLLAEESAATIKFAEQLLPRSTNAGENASAEDNLNKKLEATFSKDHAERLERLIKEKSMSEIPAADKRDAKELVNKGEAIEIGKMQEIRLADGRRFDIYVPPALRTFEDRGQARVPAVVALHGVLRAAVANERNMNESSGLNLLAEREGFVAIYPHPTKLVSLPPVLGWSIPDRENLLPTNPRINDVDEIEKMISYTRDNIVPIANKVGMLGHSDGGRMAQGFAIAHPDEVAYLVPWSSTWMKNDAPPTQSIPTRIILNEKDETLPINGGEGRNSRIGDIFLHTNVADSRPFMMGEVWAKANKSSGAYEQATSDKVTSRFFKNGNEPLRIDTIGGSSHSIADWHNIGGGTSWSPADTSLNMTYDVVKGMMPYLVAH